MIKIIVLVTFLFLIDSFFTPVFAAVAREEVWTGLQGGGDNRWNSSWNWVGGLNPDPGDILVFGNGPTLLTPTNDFPVGSLENTLAEIRFNGATSYVVSGNAITLTGGGTGATTGEWAVLDNSSVNQTFGNDITLQGSLSIEKNANTGVLLLSGAITNNGVQTLTVKGLDGDITISGVISGTGALTKTGNAGNLLTLSGNNTYSGLTTITSGTLQIGAGGTTGTLGSGAVVNNAALKFNRSDALTVANAISGSGTLEQAGTGTLIINTANTYSGATIISSGTLQIGHANALGTGAVTNNATLDVGTTNLSGIGAYTQASGSTLKLSANSSSNYGKITSGVAATVDSGSTVDVIVNGYIPNNATFKIIDTGGLGIGSAPNTVNSSSSFVTFTGVNSGGNLVFTANRSVSGFQQTAANSNAAAVGAVLDNITNPSADMATVLTTLGNLSSSEVASSENTLTPTADRGLIDTVNGVLNRFVDTTVLRLQDSKVEDADKNASSRDTLLRNDIWLQTYGDYAHQGKRGLSNGYLGRLWGEVIGIDRSFMDNSLRLGLAQGFGRGRIRSKDSCGRTAITSYQTGLYGEYQGKNRPYIFDAVLTYGYNDYESSRSINVGGINRTASSDYNGQQFSSYLEGGYKFKNKKFDIIPLLTVNYTHLHVAGYTETGADSLNLIVDAQNYDTLQLGMGCRISRAFETKNSILTPELRFRYFYDVINDKQQTLATFAGGGTSFQTTGYRPAPSSFNIGARFEFFNKKNITILADCNTVLKDGYYEAGGSLTFKYSF